MELAKSRKTAHFQKNMALAHPRMARQGEVIPERDLNAKKAQQMNRMNKPSVFIRTSFSCRAQGSNPGPLEIVILQ